MLSHRQKRLQQTNRRTNRQTNNFLDMKRLFLIVAAFAVLSVPTAMAQKINEAAFRAKMEKSDAEIKDAKKAAKAATWLNRAKAYGDAITEPTKTLFTGLDGTMLRMTMGEPEEVENTKNAAVWVYPWVKVYVKANKVVAWEQTKEIAPNAYDAVREAYIKAYELDEKSAAKIKVALDALINYYSQTGAASIDAPNYNIAIDSYIKAAQLQEHPVYSKVDPQYYFFAGELAAFLGAEDIKNFALGEKYLNKAKELGYMDENGNFYYFLFHCYYGQKDIDKANLIKAKETLLEGIGKFPKNERVLDGLMQLYTSEEGVGDPNDIVSLIDKALAESPDNPDLWFGRGRVFFKLKNYDECIASFEKINELKPNDYSANFYLGYFHIAKGDSLNKAFNSKEFSSSEEYNAEMKKVSAAYMKAVPYLEKALELQPDNADCAQYLKELCFRLRDEEGMMEKYTKYNAIYKKLKGIE